MNLLPEQNIFNKKINQFFWNVKNVLGHDFDELLLENEIPIRRTNFQNISVSRLHKICNQLNVSLDSIINDHIDYECLSSQHKGIDSLPERYYKLAPFSSRYTTISMMNFIIDELGEETGDELMKHFQLKPSHFHDIKSVNNILLPSSFSNYLHHYFGPEIVERMGRNSVKLLAQTPVGKRMLDLPTTKEMLDYFFEEVAEANVEKNYLWKIESMEENKIVISGTPNPQIKEFFESYDVVTLPSLVLQRKGFIHALTQLKNNRPLFIRTSREIRSKRLVDLYEVNSLPSFYH